MSDTRSRGNVSERTVDTHGKEILEKIFKSREILLDQQVIAQLRKALPDEKVVDAVFDYYKKRLDHIKIKSNKFKQALLRKYSLQNLSTKQMIEKAKKFTKKYDLSEGEFHMFITMLLTDVSQPYQGVFNIPSTPMSRTLGYSTAAVMGDKLIVGENDLPAFQKIMELDRITKQLHKQLILQTLTYTDCGPDALNGTFDKNKHNAFKYVHPVIAALFLPKVPYLDEQMLLASISNIVKCKHEGTPIVTHNEYELYWDLITDPNHTVCVTDNTKTMDDLKNRVVLQTKLWESVMNLRLGRYYADDMAGFLAAVETCQNSIFDAPDLVYTHDEGTILRRLLNVFSLRPTVVSISALSGLPATFTTMSLSPVSYTQITTVPMINLRLPRQLGNSPIGMQTVSLTDAFNQPQWFIEGKTIVPKTQSIVHSRDVLFFYIDRRYKAFNYATLNKPFMFTGFPPSMSGLDSVNDTRINFSTTIRVGDDDFDLRSVVFVEVTNLGADKGGKIITGCSTGIVIPPSQEKGTFEEEFFQYNPQGAGFTRILPDGDQVSCAPITALRKTGFGIDDEVAFFPLAERRGSIFMYVKKQF